MEKRKEETIQESNTMAQRLADMLMDARTIRTLCGEFSRLSEFEAELDEVKEIISEQGNVDEGELDSIDIEILIQKLHDICSTIAKIIVSTPEKILESKTIKTKI